MDLNLPCPACFSHVSVPASPRWAACPPSSAHTHVLGAPKAFPAWSLLSGSDANRRPALPSPLRLSSYQLPLLFQPLWDCLLFFLLSVGSLNCLHIKKKKISVFHVIPFSPAVSQPTAMFPAGCRGCLRPAMATVGRDGQRCLGSALPKPQLHLLLGGGARSSSPGLQG